MKRKSECRINDFTIEDLRGQNNDNISEGLEWAVEMLFEDELGRIEDISRMNEYLYEHHSLGLMDGHCKGTDLEGDNAVLYMEDEECDDIIIKLPAQSLFDRSYINIICKGEAEIWMDGSIAPDWSSVKQNCWY